jgi:uncharacterized protein involved in exopolysaccharide biosynthesis/Mrp family chromosome partitioning ATPase
MDISVPTHQVSHAAQQTATPSQILTAVWRGRWLVLASSLILAAGAFVGVSYLPTRYTAWGTLAVETQRFTIPELQGATSGDIAEDAQLLVRTEMQVLSSNTLLQAVVDELGLTNDPEHNPLLRPPGLLARIQASALALVLGEKESTARLIDTGFARRATANELLANLKISNDDRSLAIFLDYTDTDPVVAAAVVNTLMRRYIETKNDARFSVNQKGNAALLQRVDEVRQEIAALERRMQETRARHGFVMVRAGSVGQQQLEELTSTLIRAEAERAQLEANWQRAVALTRIGGVPVEHSDVISSRTIGLLRSREADAVRRLAEVTDRFGVRHPDRSTAEAELAAVRTEIATEARRITASIGSQVQVARAREAELARQLNDARAEASVAAPIQAELTQLEKDADAQRTLLQTLLARVEQTSAEPQGAPQLPGARIVAPADLPDKPSMPRPKLAAVIGLAAGFALGGLLAVVRGGGPNALVISPSEIMDLTGLPVLSEIPQLRSGGRRANPPARVVVAPTDPMAEAIRVLRARLRFVGRGGTPRSVVFVSSVTGEGTSSLAAAFARVAATDGIRTLLLEGDLRAPSLTHLLGRTEAERGLVDALVGAVTWRDIVVRDADTPLDLLLVGHQRSGMQQLLEGVRFQSLLAEAAEDYNLIVMDAPPATFAAGALPLIHCADTAVLVVGAGVARRGHLHEAVNRLLAASNNPIAVVLNRMS